MRWLAFSLAMLFPAFVVADELGLDAAPAADAVASKSEVAAEQFEHLRSAAEHLAKGGLREEADKLREQIKALEHGQAEALLTKKEKELDALRTEVERLRKLTGRQPQIELLVQVFEASRARLKDADVPNLQLLFPRSPASTHLPVAVRDLRDVTEAIETLRKNKLVNTLAEPTLVTLSGRTVTFTSGGEFPIVVPQGFGTTSIEYKKYGTSVEATPTVLGNEKVQLAVRAGVSELDPSRGMTISGSKIPGLRERVADTAAELRFGEVLVLNGPVQQKIETQKDAKGKTHEVVNEIEMIVVITPKQVGPVEPIRNARTSSSVPVPVKK